MEKTCKDMGLSVTAAYTMFATKVTREQRIPFEITADPFYSEANMERLRANAAEMDATGGAVHEDDHGRDGACQQHVGVQVDVQGEFRASPL